MRRSKRLTFAYAEGWLAHKEGKYLEHNPYKTGINHIPANDSYAWDWEDGWVGRNTYARSLKAAE